VDGVDGGSDESRECMPCRGSGRVISNLGGSPKDVTCPWCAGTGTRQAGTDAQASWRERLAEEPVAGQPPQAGPVTDAPSGPSGPAGEPRETQPAPGPSES
jgi:hypothetical protein